MTSATEWFRILSTSSQTTPISNEACQIVLLYISGTISYAFFSECSFLKTKLFLHFALDYRSTCCKIL